MASIYSLSFLTLRIGDHSHNLEADILLHCEPEISEGGYDLGDVLHHGAHVLPQLVHGDGFPHHTG